MQAFDRDEVMDRIRQRASIDSAFRGQLLSQPRVALGEMLEIQIPEAVNISVYEETPTDIHIVIPSATDLSEEDLDLVTGAGTWHPDPPHVGCCAV